MTNAQTTFDLFGFLESPTTAWGLFEDRGGAPKRRFEIFTEGRWADGRTFILDERFRYDDGETDARVWTFKPSGTGGNRWIGTCADCVGTATLVIEPTRAVMSYVFRLKLKERTIDLDFTDRFYPIGDDAIMNRTTVKKFGLRVGEVSALFHRTPQSGEIRLDHAEERMRVSA